MLTPEAEKLFLERRKIRLQIAKLQEESDWRESVTLAVEERIGRPADGTVTPADEDYRRAVEIYRLRPTGSSFQ